MSLEWQPYIYPKIIVKEHKKERLLINADFSDWIRLEEDEFYIFQGFQDGHSTENVIKDVKERKGVSLQEATKNVKEVLGKMVLNQISFSSPHTTRKYQKRISGLQSVYVAITRHCNLKCPYCYADAGEAYPFELTTQELMDIVSDTKRLGANKIVFTGGEPLLRRDLFEVASYAKEIGLETELLTNGILINSSNIQEIKASFDYVGVSIDGSTKEIHEKLRGPNTFHKTLLGIDLLAEAGISLSFNTVVTRLNFRDIPNLARLAYSFQSEVYQTHQHIPIGRGVTDNLACSFLEMEEMSHILVKTLYKYAEEPFVRERIENNHPMKRSLRERCGAGRTELIVDSRGDLYPCRMLQTKDCLAGNIRESSLYKLYHSSKKLHECRSLGLEELNECRGCEMENLCAGGCRAYHYAYTKDLYRNHPPLCEILKEELFTNIWLKTGHFPC